MKYVNKLADNKAQKGEDVAAVGLADATRLMHGNILGYSDVLLVLRRGII